MLNASITKKDLRSGMTLYCYYCDIQSCEHFLARIGYNSGVYGWNCTVYAAGDIAVVTGYRPAGRYELTREQCEHLESIAQAALNREKDRDTAKLEIIQELENIYWSNVWKEYDKK